MLTIQYPHLILLPGLSTDFRLWQHQAAGLEEVAHISVGDLTKADTIEALAADVLHNAPSEQFALAGLSMGGYVALEIMRQAPQRVLALALLDTSARPDTPTALKNRQAAIELAQTDFPRVITELMSKQLHPDHLDDELLVGLLTEMALSLGSKTFIRQQQAMAGRIDSLPFLQHIHCPTLILCGREDAITPLGVHQEMVAAIANSGLVIVDNCGHLSAAEQPTRVNEALTHWLSNIELKS